MALVQGGQHDVEALQHGVRHVEAAVFLDVALDAVQDRDVGHQRADRGDLAGLLGDALEREDARGPRRRRMIRDRHVPVAERAGGVHHAGNAVPAIAVHRVHVQIAADVLDLQQRRQRACQRRLDHVGRVRGVPRE